MDKNKDTHFGYKTVKAADKADLVADVFHSVASRYDLMNDLMSLGIHRLWKRYTIELACIREGQTILDLAAGTGDLAKLMAPKAGKSGKIFLSDINDSMLKVGRDRMTDQGFVGNIEYIQANAEALPFKDKQFDCITIAFGLRNVTDKEAALQSIYRTLKPGGRLLILEFSTPTNGLLKTVYDEYSFKVLPKIGGLVTDDEESYKYLAESICMHPDQQILKSMVLDAGFDQCDIHNLTGGIVALHRGFRF